MLTWGKLFMAIPIFIFIYEIFTIIKTLREVRV